MCGRFVLALVDPDFEEFFETAAPADLAPRFNIAPSQPILTLSLGDGVRTASYRRWGLIPAWAKDAGIGAKLINARAETVGEKPSFRAALRQRRCLIPMTGFYEWKRDGKGRTPYFIHTRAPAFAAAGLWERWQGPDGPVETCTIITTQANAALSAIHERMPVIVPPERFATWLAKDAPSAEELAGILVPYPAEEMLAHPVSSNVNSPAAQGPELQQPVQP